MNEVEKIRHNLIDIESFSSVMFSVILKCFERLELDCSH